MYSFVVYLNVNGSGSITSVGEERCNLSAVVYLYLCGFCLERFPLPLGAWDGLRYFIAALPEPSIWLLTISAEPLGISKFSLQRCLLRSHSCFIQLLSKSLILIG